MSPPRARLAVPRIAAMQPPVGAACQGGWMNKLSTQEILDARLDDWRKLVQGLHARYRVKDFTAAAAFAAAIAEAAAAEGHQPDLKMNQDVVDLSLCTREDGLWVTEKDVGMARRITEIARQQGLQAEAAGGAELEAAP